MRFPNPECMRKKSPREYCFSPEAQREVECTWSGLRPSFFISASNENAFSHWPLDETALMAVLNVTLSGVNPSRRMVSRKPCTSSEKPRLTVGGTG